MNEAEGSDLVERFRSARSDPDLAVLEGFHAIKHAVRFGARLRAVVAADAVAVLRLATDLAPDVTTTLAAALTEIDAEIFARLAPAPPATGVIALADRPDVTIPQIASAPGPAVLLEGPTRLGNVGAVVRVAAAAGAAGVIVTGRHDPWHPEAIRGAAGLHFALPVVRSEGVPAIDRPLVAIDPRGQSLDDTAIPDRALLAFGSERHGLGEPLLDAAAEIVSIPMRDGVSSLNLATSVAVVLYTRRR